MQVNRSGSPQPPPVPQSPGGADDAGQTQQRQDTRGPGAADNAGSSWSGSGQPPITQMAQDARARVNASTGVSMAQYKARQWQPGGATRSPATDGNAATGAPTSAGTNPPSFSGQPSVDLLPPGVSADSVRQKSGPGALTPAALVADGDKGTATDQGKGASSTSQHPGQYRTTSDVSGLPPTTNTTGLDRLNASGSAQPSSTQLSKIVDQAAGQGKAVVDVDLRAEPHMEINGQPVTMYGANDWANAGLTADQGQQRQEQIIDAINGSSNVTLSDKDSVNKGAGPANAKIIDDPQAVSEEQVAAQAGAKYVHIPIPDHGVPTTANVDQLDQVFARQGNDELYFHCRGGDGRTTTAMTMQDIYHNAGQVSLDDILKRQGSTEKGGLGGEDLGAKGAADGAGRQPTTNQQLAQQRAQFLQNYYDYKVANPGDTDVPYSKWAAEKGVPDLGTTYFGGPPYK